MYITTCTLTICVWSSCVHIYMCCMHHNVQFNNIYGVALTCKLLKSVGLFCKRDLQKRRYSAIEIYNFKEPTKRSHPIQIASVARHNIHHNNMYMLYTCSNLCGISQHTAHQYLRGVYAAHHKIQTKKLYVLYTCSNLCGAKQHTAQPYVRGVYVAHQNIQNNNIYVLYTCKILCGALQHAQQYVRGVYAPHRNIQNNNLYVLYTCSNLCGAKQHTTQQYVRGEHVVHHNKQHNNWYVLSSQHTTLQYVGVVYVQQFVLVVYAAHHNMQYGVASVSRIDKITRLFLQKSPIKENIFCERDL